MNCSDSFYKNIEKLEIPSYPFYGYDNAEEIDKDTDYIKSLYPRNVKQIQKEVEVECDKLEYNGSCMFDVCPDRVHLNTIVDAIYDRVSNDNIETSQIQAENLLGPVRPPWDACGPHGNCPPHPDPPPPYPPHPGPPPPPYPPYPGPPSPYPPHPGPPPPPYPPYPGPPPRPDYRPDGKPNWMRDLIQSLLFNEMLHRRRRFRSRKRWNNR